MPNSVTSLNRRPVFKWVIWLGVAPTTDAKKTCSKEIGLCAQNMTTILGSIVNIIVGVLYVRLMSVRIFTLIMHKILI